MTETATYEVRGSGTSTSLYIPLTKYLRKVGVDAGDTVMIEDELSEDGKTISLHITKAKITGA